MTLERHKSKLIPEIDFGHGGELFVTDSGGTFPLRIKGGDNKPRNKLLEGLVDEPPPDYTIKGYNSMGKKRLYKNKEESQFAKELNDMNGTWGSRGSKGSKGTRGSASLARRLKRRNYRDSHNIDANYGTYDSQRKPRRRGSPPRAPNNYPGSLNRSKKKPTVNVSELKAYSNGLVNNNEKDFTSLPDRHQVLFRRSAEEPLKSLYFIVTGAILLVAGIGVLVASWWHLYFSLLWTGALVLCLGVAGVTHNKNYFSRHQNGAYICFGILSGIAVLVALIFVLLVLMPLLKALAFQQILKDNSTLSNAPREITFSNWGKSLADPNLDERTMTQISIALQVIGLIILLLDFYTLSATMIDISNHWDAVYVRTGECDHRGKPRFFNPIEQVSVGQVVTLFGAVAFTLQVSEQNTYYSQLWCGALSILAGMVSVCNGKRPDLSGLAATSLVLEFIAAGAAGVAVVFSTLSLVDDINTLELMETQKKPDFGIRIAAAVSSSLFIVALMVAIIYAVGVVFRIFRKSCCSFDLLDPTLGPESMKY